MSTTNIKPMWHVYVRKGTAFVPNVAKTKAGFFLDVEPVRVAKLDDLPTFTVAIEQAMASGNPQVPTPTRAEFPKPVILKPAGVKSWNSFVERGACFTIFRSDVGVEIAETGRDDDGKWPDAPSSNQKFPAGFLPTEIAKCIVERAILRSDLA